MISIPQMFNSPWKNSQKLSFDNSIYKLEKLLNTFGISRNTFEEEWSNNQRVIHKLSSIELVKYDWIWFFYLPFISYLKSLVSNNSNKLIIGISGLPGTGKSTCGKYLQALSHDINIPINVVSMDDFYLPSYKLDKVMNDNPWKVPRGLPGSHSVREITESLDRFIETGILKAPQFDKSLRNGLGDRSGYITSKPSVLILEGWFLGCLPLKRTDTKNLNVEKSLTTPLNQEEINYRMKTQKILRSYLPVWGKLSSIWHLKPEFFSYTSIWKKEQENYQFKTKGSSLQGVNLESFVRMINASLPHKSLLEIDSDVKVVLSADRQIKNILTK